ncbi:40-residue YVTN family beta-propeller repeat-containing protein [Nocardioides scoriae]|uniref:40-residue YVTN family beta-propeller repeat-containing protein n=1 Tax=Nocardioides scoriae TaxID=642780 RepID=A0A1H1P3J3_9ACTN|nr:40-residue YVTN family beta-propeller repeat-containing protein [Nocardioides scoriae]
MVGTLTCALASGGVALGLASPAQAATTYDVIATLPLGAMNDSLAIDSEHGSVFVVHGSRNSVSVIDTATNTVKATIPVGSGPNRVAVDEGLDRAYVTNHDGRSVSVIDTATNTVVSTIEGLDRPRGIAVDPTTHKVYVALYFGGEVLTVLDPTVSPMTRVSTGYLGSRPWAVDVDPTTHRAYPTTLFGGTLSTVSGSSILHTLGGFGGPTQVTVDPLTKRAYVAHSGVISEVDISADTAVTRRTLVAGTDLAIDADERLLYVTSAATDDVAVIDQATDARVATVPVGTDPVAVEVDQSTHRAYVVNNNGTLSVIAPRASQAITFTSLAPTEATVGGDHTVTATGGASGEPVTFSTASTACSVSAAGEVDLLHPGDCTVAADQAGDDAYAPAGRATQSFTISREATTAVVSLDDASVVFGDSTTATAEVGATRDGAVQFTVDGDPVGSAVAVAPDGTATSPDLTDLAVGAHPVGAVFSPTDENRYAPATAAPQTLTVDEAATTTTLTVTGSDLTAQVAPVAPGSGEPTGTVRFLVAGTEVGQDSLEDGEATLAHQVPAGATRQVAAVYDGDGSFAGSSDSSSRQDPTVTTSTTSTRAPRHGWYSAPVTVDFRCQPTSGALTEPCPAPVTLAAEGAGQSVTRTVLATDGGATTVVVGGIDIDTTRPTVELTGVRAGATYFAAGPDAACRSTDRLSGVESCTVARTTRGRKVTYVATATDRAGNTSSTRLVARTTKVAVSGAAMEGGRYVVRRGRTYTVLVAATSQPRWVNAAPAPRRPAGGNYAFTEIAKGRWALGVSFNRPTKHHTLWNFGTRVGGTTTVTTVKVVG